MIREGFRTKGYHNHTLNSDLPYAFHSLRPQKTSKAHGKSWRDRLLVRFLLSEVKPNSVFDQQLMFLLWFSDFEDVCGRVKIVDVGDSNWERWYLRPISTCSSATMAATSSEVKRTLVFTFSPLSGLPSSISKIIINQQYKIIKELIESYKYSLKVYNSIERKFPIFWQGAKMGNIFFNTILFQRRVSKYCSFYWVLILQKSLIDYLEYKEVSNK